MSDPMTTTAARFKPEYGNKVMTGVGRIVYPHLVAPDPGQYGNNCYKATFLVVKDQAAAVLENLRAECIRVAKVSFPDVDLASIDWPWKDGDTKEKRSGHVGCIYLGAKAYAAKRDGTANPAPTCIAADGRSIIDAALIYGGCYVRINVTPKTYQMVDNVKYVNPDGTSSVRTETASGVSLLLNGVQFIGDGEKLAGDSGPLFDAATPMADPTQDPATMPF